MLDILITSAVLLLISVGTGFFVKVWCFVIGDPGDDLETVQGRPLSALGAWLLKKHNEFDEETKVRVQRKFAALLADAKERWRMKHPGQEFPAEHPVNTMSITERPNWWKATGLCPPCCLVWAAMIAFGLSFGLLGLSAWWLFGVVPFVGVASFALSVARSFGE